MEKIRKFCPHCWGKNEYTSTHCASCGKSLLSADQESYRDKLIWALHHPVTEIAIRAAYLLGELKAKEAIPELETICKQSHDIFLKKAAAAALEKINAKTVDK